MYRWPLAAAFLVVYCIACVLILAPEIRRGLFDRLGRRATAAPIVFLMVVGFLFPSTAVAEDLWRKMTPTRQGPEICLTSDQQNFTYLVLDQVDPVEFEVNGPRRIKLVSRYAFGSGDPDKLSFGVTVKLDGAEILRKNFTAQVNETVVLCERIDRVSSLRRAYIDLPKGAHVLQITGQTTGGGDVVIRLYRENKRKTSSTVAFAPAGYSELATLQFESGKQSTYYRFDNSTPLAFAITGPTNLQLYTRLDFNPGMLGSQKHMLEVWRDGELWRTFHYDSTRLANAFYPDHLDILPGTRKKLRISVPDGLHQFEVRCVRPENCGITAQIRIPRKDLRGSP